MVRSEKPVLPTVSKKKHENTSLRDERELALECLCAGANSVSFISLSFIMMIANLNLNAAAVAAMVAPRGGQFYY